MHSSDGAVERNKRPVPADKHAGVVGRFLYLFSVGCIKVVIVEGRVVLDEGRLWVLRGRRGRRGRKGVETCSPSTNGGFWGHEDDREDREGRGR